MPGVVGEIDGLGDSLLILNHYGNQVFGKEIMEITMSYL